MIVNRKIKYWIFIFVFIKLIFSMWISLWLNFFIRFLGLYIYLYIYLSCLKNTKRIVLNFLATFSLVIHKLFSGFSRKIYHNFRYIVNIKFIEYIQSTVKTFTLSPLIIALWSETKCNVPEINHPVFLTWNVTWK